ncbi:Protein-L-isoaspartate(D-aspartate) O-methyltransferase [Methylobacterium sp. 4-46]|uniref:protein-L-isoaspartate O-methyltransferase family protein n=1 Tax=unclassified Methylobacterium TaxID=2615210 RepID=UPI000152E795|nr:MULTISPECIES: protein-L-isoaspartate O-methyltransferase [Methylobacterium]ACA20831.1 Protein-L-isoaspartate(D-aspartate) O-methyltransferase [Methylobacterium sp. 4-46]WFT79986.1 protein-L-isoaspartate O-methyltransferase [Methylobacterium nodulans]
MDEDPEGRGAVEAASFALALRARGVRDAAVLGAMERVPRDRFAPEALRDLARRDVALPLACGQTMTAPSVVAAMLTALEPRPGSRALEIGTGSGYATALLLRLGCAMVESLERYATLASDAQARLDAAGLGGAVRLRIADGCAREKDVTPFDRILVNGVLPAIPDHLGQRLAPGGRLVGAVVTEAGPRLAVIERGPEGLARRLLDGATRIAPLTAGRAAVL